VAVWLGVRGERPAVEGASGSARQADLERRVAQLGQRVGVLEEDVDGRRVSGGLQAADVETQVRRRTGSAVSHVGLVRYDAFEDTGGAQSFSLALIDDDGDGVVVTSLHSRQATRLYAKAMRGGVADTPLSDEEVRALREAGILS
jgi:hypothetical protein